MASEEENLSKTLEESDHDEEMPTASETLATATASSSDDSGSEEEADEGADELRIQALEQALRNQPLDYDSHLQYVNCLRKSGEIEKLRNAREEMNRLFPLSPKLWQDWIGDEISLNQGAEAFAEIEKLYERAVQEYLSVPLWCDYINFVQERDESVLQCSPNGATKMRELLERAITVAGFHVTEGNKIWEAYREYEQALLLTIDEENTEEKAKQNQRIRSLFHRQLAVPLTNIKATLMDYKAWEADQGNSNDMHNELDGVPPNIALNYQKASTAYNARKQYEDQLSSPVQSEADKLQHFMNYIKFEESSGDPARVQILYERAISEFAVSSDLWLAYTNYLDRTLKVASILKSVYYRATRNCPWISELWVRYLLSLERTNSSEEEIKSVFEQSLQCAFQTAKEYLDLYLTRIDGLRRRFSLDQRDFDFQLIRQTFMDASDSLSAQILPEELLSLHKYWAKLEINLGKDIIAAREVWDNLIKKSGSTLESYEGYIAMEVAMGNLNEARAIYKRCYAKRFAGTGSEDICHSWIKFEREHGTLEDYDVALKKVTTRLNEVMLFKAQQESKGKIDHSSVSVKETTSSPLKRKPDQKSSAKAPLAKKRRQNTEKLEEKPQPDHGRMEVDSKEQLEKEEEGKEIGKPKPEFYNDQCTAFVSSLNLRTNEEDLKSFFSDCGGATAVRLVRDKVTGKSREQEKGREPRWSDELFQPTHTKKTREYITGKAKEAQEKYESAMVQKYGEDRNTWPAYDGDVWYSTGISDQNDHGDNYGLGALGKTRCMFRFSGSSSQSHSSQSYSSMPPAPQLTEEHIDMISTRVLDRMEDRLLDREDRLLDMMEDRFMSRVTELFRASQGGSGSQHASRPAPQDDEDDDEDDDVGGDGTT